jgi:alkylation response protein AidB-like acyl-CoA dehydrogenase
VNVPGAYPARREDRDLPWPGVEVVRTPQYSHHIADEHPIVAFNDVRVPAANLVGTEGRPMTFTQDWFRFERMMVAARCVGGRGPERSNGSLWGVS